MCELRKKHERVDLYIPLHLFYSKSPETSLSLISLQYNEINLSMVFRRVS